jgi:hypothetical protein
MMQTIDHIRRFSFLMVLTLLVSNLFAQGGEEDRQRRFEEMKSKRAAFFTERIGLTPREAERFWPTYNSLQSEKEKLNARRGKLYQTTKLNNNGEKVPDFEKISDEMINIRVKEATLEKLYHDKFKKILSPEKMMKYYRTEEDWGRELLKQYQQRSRGWF